jgi:alpha-beta hydrolase superfamily lysophospholipase
MKRLLLGTAKKTFKALVYGGGGGFVVLVAIFIFYLEGRPDLSVWHTAELDAEFTADTPAREFGDYLAAEALLFQQLEEQVLDRIGPGDRRYSNRYFRGSASDPGIWPLNWNRTFELPAAAPAAGVLLLHGMSDSPYSLRSIGVVLNNSGAHVIGLRLPGHGTAPSGLVTVQWEDMAAAVRLAMAHLKRLVGDRPLFIVGYSNGGALAVQYALSTLDSGSLPPASGLVLVSPAIGVTGFAALAVWQARLGHLLGLNKLAWNSILPEYDPYKYQSFAVNAGDQVYRLTMEIQARLDAVKATGVLERFPPVLAFQSAVDATVSTRALVSGLFQRLPAGGHELVIFDVNRTSAIEELLSGDPRAAIKTLLGESKFPFGVTVLTNSSEHSRHLVQLSKTAGENRIVTTPLDLTWPGDLYSLSHVALPFPPGDPLYGALDPDKHDWISLGRLDLRGERGVLQIPAADMLRLKWNPFHRYIENRLPAFTGLAEGQ